MPHLLPLQTSLHMNELALQTEETNKRDKCKNNAWKVPKDQRGHCFLRKKDRLCVDENEAICGSCY